MLATQKSIYSFEAGAKEPFSFYQEKNQRNRNYFFMACYEIGELMEKIRSEIKEDDFLFYWVDGIYLKSKKSAEKAEAILKGNNYFSVIEKINKFRVFSERGNKFLEYYRDGEIKPKVFTLPDNQQHTINKKSLHLRYKTKSD
jgi:hypothetical protein